ncbi:MAG TPA: hypothetical protein VFE65_35490 [Pseudonocardia sp.]|nr:hypothetical protein [Pseudonocardia sp.]
MRDPIVPLDFGSWAQRVYRCIHGNFRRLGTLAMVPVGLIGLYLIIGDLAKPDPDEIKQRLLAEIAAHPGVKVSLTTQFWILYGRTVPISVVFGILVCGAGILYEACAHYLVLRRANGQPTSLAEALQAIKPRLLPFLGQSILAALILVVGALTPPILGTFFLPDGTKIIGNIVAIAVILFLSTVFWATFGGVVLIERAGTGRCFRLVRPRFWTTLGRMLPVALIYSAFTWLLMVIWVTSEPTGGTSVPSER